MLHVECGLPPLRRNNNFSHCYYCSLYLTTSRLRHTNQSSAVRSSSLARTTTYTHCCIYISYVECALPLLLAAARHSALHLLLSRASSTHHASHASNDEERTTSALQRNNNHTSTHTHSYIRRIMHISHTHTHRHGRPFCNNRP